MAMMERLRMKTIGTSIMVVQDQTSYDKVGVVKESSYRPCREYLEVHGIRAGKKSQVFLYL